MNIQSILQGGRGLLAAAFMVAAAVVAGVSASVTAHAAATQVVASGDLESKTRGKRLNGAFEIVTLDDGRRVVRFDDAFRASRGPDLKVFLSPQDVASVNGRTAVDGSINLGELRATRGAQEYEIPADVDLATFSSVLVHCEQFSVLWGGGDI